MLEIGVSLRRGSFGEGTISDGDSDIKKAGDIVVAKRFGAAWGKEERRLFLIALLEDDDFEDQIEADDVLAYPYSVMVMPKSLPKLEPINNLVTRASKPKEDLPEPPQSPKMVNRSKYRVKVGQTIGTEAQPNMFEGSPGIDPTDITSEPCSPTTKIGTRQFCKVCNAVHASAEVCPVCGHPMVEFLELSDLYFDDSPRE